MCIWSKSYELLSLFPNKSAGCKSRDPPSLLACVNVTQRWLSTAFSILHHFKGSFEARVIKSMHFVLETSSVKALTLGLNPSCSDLIGSYFTRELFWYWIGLISSEYTSFLEDGPMLHVAQGTVARPILKKNSINVMSIVYILLDCEFRI